MNNEKADAKRVFRPPGPSQSGHDWCNTHHKIYGPGTIACEWYGLPWELQDTLRGL